MSSPKDRTVQETREMIVLGKYLPVLCPELQVWIKEINPTSVAEAANLPDVFVVAQKKAWSFMTRKTKDSRKSVPQRPAASVSRASYGHPPQPKP